MSTMTWIDELKNPQGLQRLLAERGAHLAVAVLLAALAIQAAIILTSLWTHDAPATAPVPLALPPAPNPSMQLASIVSAHLFGTAAASAGGGDGSAPQTTMPLVLAGVIAIRDPDKGQAIIGQNANSAKLYSVGSMIPGGARLHAVYGDRVLLERNGTLEALMLPRNASHGSAMPAPSAAKAQSVRDASALFGGLVRVQPVFTGGKLNGYRIFPGGKGGTNTFSQLGLRSGDLITAVNGTPLDDQGKAMEVLQTLSSAATATVTVSRNGVPQEVNLNLSNLNPEADASEASASAPASESEANPGIRSGRLGGAAGAITPPVTPAPPPAPGEPGADRQ